MDFGDKVARAELSEQHPALLESIQLSTPQSRVIGLTMRVPTESGAFVFCVSFLSPEAADHTVVFSFSERPIRLSTRKTHNERQRITMMIEEKFARQRTYRNNINRYRGLLKTELSVLERQFIERRLNEEKSAMESLAASSIPITFEIPKPLRSRRWFRQGNHSTIVMAAPVPKLEKTLHEDCPG
jgi:hypothetical protein